MSQENVEATRRAFESVRLGDLAAMFDLVDKDVELHENVLAPDAAVYRGPEGIRKWYESGLEAFVDFRFEPERFIEAGQWVLVEVRAHGRGRQSGAEFSARYVSVFKWRAGKAVFIASYADLKEAFEGTGLSAQDVEA
jgi:ketosteroid isomerase-like protein